MPRMVWHSGICGGKLLPCLAPKCQLCDWSSLTTGPQNKILWESDSVRIMRIWFWSDHGEGGDSTEYLWFISSKLSVV